MPFVIGVESTVFPGRASDLSTWPTANAGGLGISLARARGIALALTIIVALAFRTAALSTYGFSEDEINKVQAIEQYRAGHFIANVEHPMLMKLAMWGSVAAADAWNSIAPIDRRYGAMVAAFLAANVTVLSPATWRYCFNYVQGSMLVHHGYLYAGQLYVTNIPISPLGVPAGYYLHLLATKVPLVVLAAAVPGFIEIVRRRHERGFVLLRVLVVFLLVPYSLMAAKFIRYSLPMLATLDLIAAVGIVAGIGWLLRKGWLSWPTRVSVATLA